MVPYQDGDRNFRLWVLASTPRVYPFVRRAVRSFSIRRSYVVKEDQREAPSMLHRWRFFSTLSKPPYCSTKSEHAWVNAWPNSQLLSSYLKNTIVKNATSMGSIWSAIRLHFGFEATRGHFLDFFRNPPRARRTTWGSLSLLQRITSFVTTAYNTMERSSLKMKNWPHFGKIYCLFYCH